MIKKQMMALVMTLAAASPALALSVADQAPIGPEPQGGLVVGRGGPGPVGRGPVGPRPVGPGPIGLGPLDIGPMRPLSAPLAMDPQEREREQKEREAERKDREREQKEREAERKDRERERESEAYEQGQDAMDESRWDRAIGHFNRVIEMKGPKVDAALYWKAYSQNRQGLGAESLTTIAELTKSYPNSRYLKDAKALEVEVRSRAGQPIRPENQADEELKLMALRALQNADPEQAVPMLEKFLNSPTSPRLKSQALFVLAQTNTPRAREVLKNLAKGSSTPELQSKAIQYLGVNGGPESRAVLAEVYAATTDVDVKRRILRAVMTPGETGRLLTSAQSRPNTHVPQEAR